MNLSGKLFIKNKIVRIENVEYTDDSKPFHLQLENGFILLCKSLDIPIPLWMSKNTKELSICKKTSFFKDQFYEKFSYDKFDFRIEKL